MKLTKQDILFLFRRIYSGVPVEHACDHISIDQAYEDFDKVMSDAIFDVWMHTGDSGFNRDGFRETFDAIENQFFPKNKEEKVHTDDEHLTFATYF
tara:strand:+ start:223 stop:510 length:288 start_codon:yes stop_codon:yes gene_type:complete